MNQKYEERAFKEDLRAFLALYLVHAQFPSPTMIELAGVYFVMTMTLNEKALLMMLVSFKVSWLNSKL